MGTSRSPQEGWAEIDRLVELAKRKLEINSHKPYWQEPSVDYLLLRLHEEVAELQEAVTFTGHVPEIEQEAADVVNMAMMVASRCGGLRGDCTDGR